jgi:hypothetical protein
MNIRKVSLGIGLIGLTMLLVATCATKPAVTKAEPLYGTWGNEEYTRHHKVVYEPDGNMASYYSDQPDVPRRWGTFVIEEKWTDAEENTWYNVRIDSGLAGDSFFLIRINASEDTLEFEYNSSSYPEEFSSSIGDKFNHKILYRQ